MGKPTKAAHAAEESHAMDIQERAELLQTLELKYQEDGSTTELLVKDEDMRRLRTRILLLRDDNTTLRNQVEDTNHKADRLETQCHELTTEIDARDSDARAHQEKLRQHEREYSDLKAELQAMTNSSNQSAGLLSEKLALSTELAALKPEMDHLRSQVSQHQSTLSDKLALEQQVSTLEMELAKEKKAAKRAMQSRESNDRVEDELRKKLREVERSLNAETTERERLEDRLEQEKRTREYSLKQQDTSRELENELRKKLQDTQTQLREANEERDRLDEELQEARREHKKSQKNNASDAEQELRSQLAELQKSFKMQIAEAKKSGKESQAAVSESEAQKAQLQRRLDKAEAKLQETMDQLKQSQAASRNIQQPRAPSQTAPDIPNTTKIATKAPAPARKRKAQDLAMDDFSNIEIATPSADSNKARRPSKKQPVEKTAPVEKSTFSITPFLNRSRTSGDLEAADEDDLLEDSILGSRPAEEVELTTEPPTENALDSTETNDEEQKPKRGRPKKALAEAASAKKNAQPASKKTSTKPKGDEMSKVQHDAVPARETSMEPSHQPKRKPKAAVEESAPEVEVPVAKVVTKAAPQSLDSLSSFMKDDEQPKKRKRNLGMNKTSTLFDEEDEGVPRTATKGKVPLSAKRNMGKTPLIGNRNAFAGSASFSPLKKDRRGVGASFLA